MRITCTLFSILAISGILAARSATAKDEPLEFIHLLQKEGYPDVAIDYLEDLKKDPSASKDVMEVWDLEMSRSMKEAVRMERAYDSGQAKKWAEESKALLERFVKANPNRPEAIQEAARQSEEKALEGQYAVIKAGYTTDPAEKAKLLEKARSLFEEIRPRFVQALKSAVRLRDSMGPSRTRGRDRKREDAIVMAAENRLTVAMVDFYLAQSQEAGPQRTAALTKCIKEFDDIYQSGRETQFPGVAFVGWRAHFWHGRILQELGKTNDAKAIYEEVAACDARNIEDVGENKEARETRGTQARAARRTGLEDFFADVEQYYLQVLWQLSDKKVAREYIEEAGTWRKGHKLNSDKCFGYQALTLELAKNLVTMDKKKTALLLLGEMVRIPSPYQEDAIKLRRQLNPNASAEEGFEDAVIDGDKALESRKWAEATECYEKALKAATPTTDKDRLAIVQNTVVACYHNQAMKLYQNGKMDEAVAMAKKALKGDFLKTKAAPGIAVFMLNVQYYQYLGAPEGTEEQKKAKSELLPKLSATAKSILKFWAAREEGDAARIILMRLALAEENMKDADKYLNEINPASKEYPKALTVMGFAHWYKYKTGKKALDAEKGKPDKEKADKLAEDRKAALEIIEKAVKTLDVPRTGDAAMPEALREAQLLLAEIWKEGEDFKKSWELYKPLVDEIVKDSSKPFDETALRILDGAGQVSLQLGEVPNITSIATTLMDRGADQGQINLMIMNFAKRLEIMRKKALTEGDSGDAATGADALKSKPLIELEEKVMANLAKRDKISAPSMIWIVKTTSNLGTESAMQAAADLIEKIFDRVSNDQAFAQDETLHKAEVSLHALGASLQAKLGKYEEAQGQIKSLIEARPKALEPRVSEAKILTEWASHNPEKYPEAIIKWDNLRKKLEASSGAKTAANAPARLDPKYDVILNEADCFCRWAQKTKSKDDAKAAAKKGMDLISPYLNLDDKIRNPDDEYRELSFRYFQVGGKLAEVLGVSKPIRPKARRTRS